MSSLPITQESRESISALLMLMELQDRLASSASRATISRAVYPFHRGPPHRTKEGSGRSSIRSRSEHRSRYYEPSHDALAHLAKPAVGRTGHCSTEVRLLSASRTD